MTRVLTDADYKLAVRITYRLCKYMLLVFMRHPRYWNSECAAKLLLIPSSIPESISPVTIPHANSFPLLLWALNN
ncbi:hypothetical protein IF1G_02496 [Cordyceps javanica]|uniref:Uncharacterized protein n=1 Tax=Cordyceps javanica TaxID=43265 RepID=A0A545V9K9_9HYPO|nr:hypothetical protein IF1G_02496 [Cordyceps javanica]